VSIASDSAEQWAFVVMMPVCSQIGDEVDFEIVVAGHGVRFATLLAQPHPEATVQGEHVSTLINAERGADPARRNRSSIRSAPGRRNPVGVVTSMLSSKTRASAGAYIPGFTPARTRYQLVGKLAM